MESTRSTPPTDAADRSGTTDGVGTRARRSHRRRDHHPGIRASAAMLLAVAMTLGACSSGEADTAVESSDGTTFDDGGATEGSAGIEPGFGDDAADGAAGDDGAAADDGGDAASAEERGAPSGGGASDADTSESTATEPDTGIGTGGTTGVGALTPADIGRDIVFTATLDLTVDDVVEAGRRAQTAVEAVGGILFGQETSTRDVPRTQLVFKVPPAQFQLALSRLGEVGVLTDQVITADDVTERVVDLQSRITTAGASVERLRGLLDRATDLRAIANLENELLRRETDLEVLRGQLRTLSDQVDLATIIVGLTQSRPGPALEVTRTFLEGPATGSACVGDDELTVDEGAVITLCVEVVNTGDTHLDEVVVIDSRLDLDARDFSVRRGDLDAPLAPGEAVTVSATLDATPGRGSRTIVQALAVDGAGTDLGLGQIEGSVAGGLDVAEDDSLPGPLEALEKGASALAVGASIVLLVLAFSLPFLWIPVVAWLGWTWLARRRRRAQAAPRTLGDVDAGGPVAPMPPPVPASADHEA